MDLLGSEYVIEHVTAECINKEKERLYRIYTTDVLKVIAEGRGATIPIRYEDWITPVKEERTEEVNGDEIALEVIRKAGLKVG